MAAVNPAGPEPMMMTFRIVSSNLLFHQSFGTI
jgi:hypothetical protein